MRAKLLKAAIFQLVSILLLFGASPSAATIINLTSDITSDVTLDNGDGYRLAANVKIKNGADVTIASGVVVGASGAYTLEVEGGSSLYAVGTSNDPVVFTNESDAFGSGYTGLWGGIKFSTSTSIVGDRLEYCEISNASYAVYVTGVIPSSGRLPVVDCTINDCGVGVYVNNSKVLVQNTNIADCDIEGTGRVGIHLTNTSAGKVLIDCVGFSNNRIDILCDWAEPEVIDSFDDYPRPEHPPNLYHYGSSPDYDVSGSGGNRPNSWCVAGGSDPDSPNGAAFGLYVNSYPQIHYNNIWDGEGDQGFLIYKDPYTNSKGLNAENNYWGATPDDDFFYWGNGDPIDYSPYAADEISDADDYELAMDHWNNGNFEEARDLFRESVYEDGEVGLNSVRYLYGCATELNDNLWSLRNFYRSVARDHDDEDVAWVAKRFATQCLTDMEYYFSAMSEYYFASLLAENVADSVMAVIDYLAVVEQANNGADAVNLHRQVSEAKDALHRWIDSNVSETVSVEMPVDFTISEAYPNPFNSRTTVRFNIQNSTDVKVVVTDIAGREVARLQDGVMAAGEHLVTWNANGVPTGIYFCHITANDNTAIVKLAMVK